MWLVGGWAREERLALEPMDLLEFALPKILLITMTEKLRLGNVAPKVCFHCFKKIGNVIF